MPVNARLKFHCYPQLMVINYDFLMNPENSLSQDSSRGYLRESAVLEAILLR